MTPTLSVEADQFKSTDEVVTLEAVRLLGVVGACVSAAEVVVIIKILLKEDSFPAASTALT